MPSTSWDDSQEKEDWIDETGGRDEDYNTYYERWERRNRGTSSSSSSSVSSFFSGLGRVAKAFADEAKKRK